MMVFPYMFGGGYYYIHHLGAANFVLEESGFVGTLPLVTSVWILFRKYKKNAQIRFWGIVGFTAFFLVFGRYNPLAKFILHLPGMNFFRAPARNWFEFDFAAAVLFAFGMEELIYSSIHDRKKCGFQLASGMGIVLCFGFFLLLIKKIYSSILLPSYSPFQMMEITHFFVVSNPIFWVPMFFIFCYLFLILMFSFSSNFQKIAVGFLAFLIFAEAFSFGAFEQNRWLKISAVQKMSNNSIFQFLKKNIGFNRYGLVEGYTIHKILTWPLLNIPNDLSVIDGYDPMVSNRFYKLTGVGYGTRELPVWDVLLKNNLIISLLNVKYLIIPSFLKTRIGKMKFSDGFYQTKRELLKGKWLLSSVNKLHKIYYLKSPGTLKSSIVVKKLKIKPGKIYLLSFKAKASQKPNSNLYCDLFLEKKGSFSDKPLLIIHPKKLHRHFKTFFALFIGGLQKEAYVRIYTYSKDPILILKPQIFYFKKYSPLFLKEKKKAFGLVSSKRLYQRIFRWGSYSVYENLNFLPRIFSIQKLLPAQNFRRFKKNLLLLNFNPFKDAFVSSKSFSKIRRFRFSIGKAVLVKYETDRIIAKTNFPKTGFVVLSDQYYPGWEAFISGKRVPIYRTDGLLRGVMIPPGRHLLEFQYHNSFIIELSFWVSALVLVFCAAGIGLSFSRTKVS